MKTAFSLKAAVAFLQLALQQKPMAYCFSSPPPMLAAALINEVARRKKGKPYQRVFSENYCALVSALAESIRAVKQNNQLSLIPPEAAPSSRTDKRKPRAGQMPRIVRPQQNPLVPTQA